MTHLEDLLLTWDSGLTEKTVFDSVTTILMTSSSPGVREGGGERISRVSQKGFKETDFLPGVQKIADIFLLAAHK